MIPIRQYIRRAPAVRRIRLPWAPYSHILYIVNTILTGKRKGYTYTRAYAFDIEDPKTIERLYTQIDKGTLHIVAITNRKLEDWEPEMTKFSRARGIGFWTDDTGQIWADDIAVLRDKSDEAALRLAKRYKQRYILKIDGKTKSYDFLEVK